MTLIEFKADFTRLCSILERIANALDRAVPPVVLPEAHVGLSPQDVIHADSETVWMRKQQAALNERLKRVKKMQPKS